jgi:hypothetical protein
MKKVFFLAAAASIMISQTGCFGSFALVKKVYEFNDGISDNKVVKTLVFYLLNIIPIYGIASFVDVVALNLIEFWTGSNPIAMKTGEVEEQLITMKGEVYKVTATKNKMEFEKAENGDFVPMGSMIFNEKDKSWNFAKDGKIEKLVSIDEATGMVTYYNDGNTIEVSACDIENMALNNVCATEFFAMK